MKVAGINQGSVLFLDKEVKQKSMPVGQEACRTGAKVQPREQRDGHNEIAFPPRFCMRRLIRLIISWRCMVRSCISASMKPAGK